MNISAHVVQSSHGYEYNQLVYILGYCILFINLSVSLFTCSSMHGNPFAEINIALICHTIAGIIKWKHFQYSQK